MAAAAILFAASPTAWGQPRDDSQAERSAPADETQDDGPAADDQGPAAGDDQGAGATGAGQDRGAASGNDGAQADDDGAASEAHGTRAAQVDSMATPDSRRAHLVSLVEHHMRAQTTSEPSRLFRMDDLLGWARWFPNVPHDAAEQLVLDLLAEHEDRIRDELGGDFLSVFEDSLRCMARRLSELRQDRRPGLWQMSILGTTCMQYPSRQSEMRIFDFFTHYLASGH